MIRHVFSAFRRKRYYRLTAGHVPNADQQNRAPGPVIRTHRLLGMEDGVIDVWPELPKHHGHAIQ